MVEFFKKLKRDDRGATAVEYGLILAMVFLAMVGAIQSFGQTAIDQWNNVSSTVAAVRPSV